jgi:hypothetical protein
MYCAWSPRVVNLLVGLTAKFRTSTRINTNSELVRMGEDMVVDSLKYRTSVTRAWVTFAVVYDVRETSQRLHTSSQWNDRKNKRLVTFVSDGALTWRRSTPKCHSVSRQHLYGGTEWNYASSEHSLSQGQQSNTALSEYETAPLDASMLFYLQILHDDLVRDPYIDLNIYQTCSKIIYKEGELCTLLKVQKETLKMVFEGRNM